MRPPLLVVILRPPLINVQDAYARCEHPVHVVQPRRKPLVLGRPVRPVVGVDIVKIDANAAVASTGEVLPGERITQLCLEQFESRAFGSAVPGPDFVDG